MTWRSAAALYLWTTFCFCVGFGIGAAIYLEQKCSENQGKTTSAAHDSPLSAALIEQAVAGHYSQDHCRDEEKRMMGTIPDWLMVFVTGIAATVAIGSLQSLISQTAAVSEANQISRDALIADQRPWVSMRVQLIGPIHRDMDPRLTRHDWHITVLVTLHNHGKTPAMDVQVTPKLIPQLSDSMSGGFNEEGIPQGQFIRGTNVGQEVENACHSIEKRIRDQMRKDGAFHGFGEVIYPGEDESMTIRVPFPGEEVSVPATFHGHFVLVVGVTYNSTFNGDEDFKTGRAFSLWKSTGDGRMRHSGEELPVEAIGFMAEPWGIGNLTT